MTPTDKFEQNQTPEALSQNDSLNAIKKEIDDLKNEETSDDKLELNGLLTSEFSKNLKPEDANMLLKSIEEVLNNKPEFKEKKPEGLDDLIKFLKPITNPLNFSGVITGLDDKGGKFWGKIEISKEGQDSEIGTMLKNIETKLSDINTINDDRLNGVKDILNQAMVVINKPGKNNTNILQKFIYENLPDNLKEQFGVENHLKDGKFDGQFGKSTLNGLKQILTIADGIISDIKEAKNVENKGDQERSKIDEDKKAAAEDAEKKAKEIKERINKIVSGLGLKKDTNNGLDRKEFGLPSEGDLYTRDGQDGYYYFDKNVDNVMFVPLNPMANKQFLSISSYKEGTKLGEELWNSIKLTDYPAVNDYGRQSLDIVLKSALMNSDLGKYPSNIKIDNNLYKINSFGHLATLPIDFFLDGWLFKGDADHVSKDLKILNFANYLFKKFDGKTGQYEIKDNGKLVFKVNDGKEKTGIGKFDLESEYGKLNDNQIKLFCDYLNKNGNIGNISNSKGKPEGSKTDVNGTSVGKKVDGEETVATKPKDTSDGDVDNTQKMGEIVKKYGLGVVANIDEKTRAIYGLPETGNVYMIGSDTMYLYFVSQDGKSLVRTSGNPSEGQYTLPLSKFNGQIQELGKQSWEKLEAYPAVNERGRQHYDKILQNAIRGTSFGNFPCTITIGKDNGIDRYFVKTPSTDIKKNRKGIYYIQPIMRDVFTKGWMFDGTDNKTLGKNLRIINLVNHMVDRYGGRMDGATFNLKNGGELVINEFGKETTIISRSEWSRDYGKINDAKKVADFNVYLNRVCGGMYVNAIPHVVDTQKSEKSEPVDGPEKNNPVSGAQIRKPINPIGRPNIDLGVAQINMDYKINKPNPILDLPKRDSGSNTEQSSDQKDSGSNTEQSSDQKEVLSIEKITDYRNINDVALTQEINVQNSDIKIRCKKMFAEVFNLAISKYNNSEKDYGNILISLKMGLTSFGNGASDNIINIQQAQKLLNMEKNQRTGKFGMLTFDAILDYFGIKKKDEWKDLQRDIEEGYKKYKEKKAEEDRIKMNQEKVDQEERKNEAEALIKRKTDLLLDCDKQRFISIVEDLKTDYISGKISTAKEFLDKINGKFLVTPRIYIIAGEDSSDGAIQYTYQGKLDLKGQPNGEGRVDYNLNGNKLSYSGKRENGLLKSCKIYNNTIDIGYEGGVPYLKNGLSGGVTNLRLNKIKSGDVGRVASMVSLMLKILKEKQAEGKNLTHINLGSTRGELLATFDNGSTLNLKKKARKSMYIADTMSIVEINKWFEGYFKRKLNNIII